MHAALLYNAQHGYYEETKSLDAVLEHNGDHIVFDSQKLWENRESYLAVQHQEDFFYFKKIDMKNVIFHLPYPIVKSEAWANEYYRKNPKYKGPLGIVDGYNKGIPCQAFYKNMVRRPSGIRIYRVVKDLEIISYDPKQYKKYEKEEKAIEAVKAENAREAAKSQSINHVDMQEAILQLCENLNIHEDYTDHLVRILLIAHDTVYGKRSTNRILKPLAQKAQYLVSLKVPLVNWHNIELGQSSQDQDREFLLKRLQTICLFKYKKKELTPIAY